MGHVDENNKVLHALTGDDEVHIYVHVQKSNQRAQLMTVHGSTTVGDLKCAIWQRDNAGCHLTALTNGGAQEHMRIKKGGRTLLESGRTLKSYGIKEHDKVEVQL